MTMASTAEQFELADAIPFDADRLDRLMEDAGVDVLLATSKHNVQYLLGGHRPLFFETMDATGLGRYMPVLAYPKGEAEKAAYIGHRLEGFQKPFETFWTPEVQMVSAYSDDAMQKALDYLGKAGIRPRRVAVERSFLPLDAGGVLENALPSAECVDAHFILERLRAIKRPYELDMLRKASELVVDAMLATIAQTGPGATTREITDTLKREEVDRGLDFDYCLITGGRSLNRAPSTQTWDEGEILSLDSGGNYHGYIGDVTRMAIHGEPDAELQDLLGEIENIQRAAMKPVRAGAIGREIYAAAEALTQKSKHHNHMQFLAHGMGLTSHEAPRLTGKGPVPYDGYDENRPLETGMIVSVETTLQHPRRGFVKLEDTLAVTETGYEIYGQDGWGWNRGGTAAE
jgi:Xaa-Pro aminopeptidase